MLYKKTDNTDIYNILKRNKRVNKENAKYITKFLIYYYYYYYY